MASEAVASWARIQTLKFFATPERKSANVFHGTDKPAPSWQKRLDDYEPRLVESVFEAGINFFDTADIYGFQNPQVGFGDAEALLGEVFKQAPSLRAKMVLASKGGIIPPTPYNSSYDYLVNACEASLRRLNTDVLDLWQIHRPDLLTHPAEIARAVDHLIQAGKIRTFGISNYTVAQARALSAHLNTDIVSFQPEFSPLALDAMTDGTLDLAMEIGASVLAWSPLGGGRLAKDGQPIALVGTQNPQRILETREVSKIQLSPDEWYQILVASRGAPMP
jgi:predicted oxidoreductase